MARNFRWHRNPGRVYSWMLLNPRLLLLLREEGAIAVSQGNGLRIAKWGGHPAPSQSSGGDQDRVDQPGGHGSDPGGIAWRSGGGGGTVSSGERIRFWRFRRGYLIIGKFRERGRGRGTGGGEYERGGYE